MTWPETKRPKSEGVFDEDENDGADFSRVSTSPCRRVSSFEGTRPILCCENDLVVEWSGNEHHRSQTADNGLMGQWANGPMGQWTSATCLSFCGSGSCVVWADR